MCMGSRALAGIAPRGLGGREHHLFVRPGSYRRVRPPNMHLLCSAWFYSVHFSDMTMFSKLPFFGPYGLFLSGQNI